MNNRAKKKNKRRKNDKQKAKRQPDQKRWRFADLSPEEQKIVGYLLKCAAEQYEISDLELGPEKEMETMISLFDRGCFEIMISEDLEDIAIRPNPDAVAHFKPMLAAVMSGKVICANEREQDEYMELKRRLDEGEGWHDLRHGSNGQSKES